MLSPNWPYILLAIILLVLGIAVVLYLVLRGARRRAAAPLPAAAPGQPAVGFMEPAATSSVGLRASFSRSLRALRRHVTGRDFRYRLPWFLLVGEAQSGKTTLLAEGGMNLPLGSPGDEVHGVKQGVNWFFFDRGVVLDVAGEMVLRADGEATQGRRWAAVARLLQRHRPERPVDGVVLTIPCTDLLSARGLAPDRRARIEQKAVSLYRKLWEAQKHLGMSFPVYVVVTKCDQVPGFQSLCRALPARLRDEMFGWSSPYTLETAYRPEWVGEAFQNVYRHLFQTQVEIVAERAEVEDRDGLFLLPSEMQQLRAPLQLYLDQIFKESSFHESFFFRGLYFCGDAGEPAPADALLPAADGDGPPHELLEAWPDPFAPPAPAAAAPVAHRPAFVKDLFEKKIFLEDMLARPLAATRLSRNRTALAAQVLSLAIPLVGCAGLLLTYSGLERERDELHALLAQEEQDLKEVRALRAERLTRPPVLDFYDDRYRLSSHAAPAATGALYADAAYVRAGGRAADYAFAAEPPPPAPGVVAAPPAAAIRDNERRLFAAMSRVQRGSLYSVFIPTSWLSGLNSRVRDSMVVAYEQVVLEGLRLELDARTDHFVNAEPIYDRAAGPYPDGVALPDAWLGTRAGPAEERNPAPLYDQDFAVGADATLRGFIERFEELRANRARYEEIVRVGGGAPLEELGALAAYLGHEPPADGFDANNALYKRALREARGRPLDERSDSVAWTVAGKVAQMVDLLYQRSFERGPSAVSYSYLGDIAQTESLLARPEYRWLANHPFDPRSSFHDMKLASGLKELRRALEGLKHEGFMAGGPAGAPPLARRQLAWDVELLRRAAALCADYERFIAERGDFPKGLDDSVRQAALARLRANVAALVGRAQRFQPAPPAPGESAWLASLEAEVRSLQEAQEPLSQLLAATDRTGVEVGLRPALAAQVSHLLSALGSAFGDERFYATARPKFDWWDGSKPVAARAFGVGSPDELAAYLAAQRQRIAHLARELAAPVFAFAAAQNISVRRPVGSRLDWQELLAELKRYDDQQAGSSLRTLEEFIQAGMDKVEIDQCDEWEGGGQEWAARDFFIQTRNYLRHLLRDRCRVLATTEAQLADESAREADERSLDSYDKLAKAFNDTLADRFPFGGAADGVPYREADPAAVARFFEQFDREEPAARQALKRNPRLRERLAAAYEFLDQMKRVRAFFAGYLDKKAGPALDFNVEFGADREREVGGLQIAAWSLDVGSTKYNHRGEALAARWRFGEPVSLTLRWAKDSPVVPYAARETAHFRARDRFAVFDYDNRWSLLTMLMRHQSPAADAAPYEINQGIYTLGFRVPTRAGGNFYDVQPEALRAGEAHVFVRVSLKEPGALPHFPAAAPGL